jgi:hypothetical protein
MSLLQRCEQWGLGFLTVLDKKRENLVLLHALHQEHAATPQQEHQQSDNS